jgi:hypothetical protein
MMEVLSLQMGGLTPFFLKLWVMMEVLSLQMVTDGGLTPFFLVGDEVGPELVDCGAGVGGVAFAKGF